MTSRAFDFRIGRQKDSCTSLIYNLIESDITNDQETMEER